MTTEPSADRDAALDEASALTLDPDFRKAWLDEDDPGHRAAVQARRNLFVKAYGDEPVAPVAAGSGGPQIVELGDGTFGLAPAPTDAEMQAVAHRASSLAMQSAGVDGETADALSAWTTEVGLDALQTADLASAITSSRDYDSTEAALRALGDEGGRMVARAQAAVHKLGVPADILNTPVGSHLVLGEHPEFIKAMNALGQKMGL